MNKNIKYSIITINFKSIKFTNNLINLLSAQKFKNFELIVVDNKFTRSSEKSISNKLKSSGIKYTKLITSKRNLGYSGANMQAVKSAKGKYLFFMNNDIKFNSDFLDSIDISLKKTGFLGPTGFCQKNFAGTLINYGLLIDRSGYPVDIKNAKSISKRKNGVEYINVFYPTGSAIVVDRHLFLNFGGFDVSYFMFGEMMDLAWRFKLAGINSHVLPDIEYFHHQGGSMSANFKTGNYKISPKRFYYRERNTLTTLIKNYDTKNLFKYLPIIIVINLLETLYFFATGQFRAIVELVRAYCWNILNLPKTLESRRKIQKNRKVKNDFLEGFCLGIGKFKKLKEVGFPTIAKQL